MRRGNFSRSERLLGPLGMERLAQSHVLLLGVGGVGSFVAEALVRSGLGELSLVDPDEVTPSNLNRQLPALESTIGLSKLDVMAERLLDINPDLKLHCYPLFFDESTQDRLPFSKVSYLVDAIDSVPSKKLLMRLAKQYALPFLACMGAGNKVDPSRFEFGELQKTEVCPLARIMRQEARRLRLRNVHVLYSKEEVRLPKQQHYAHEQAPDFQMDQSLLPSKKVSPGSLAFVPSVAGLLIASRVCLDLAEGLESSRIPR